MSKCTLPVTRSSFHCKVRIAWGALFCKPERGIRNNQLHQNAMHVTKFNAIS